ncbi:MAG TPA: glycosyltransferase [Tepidisphaeraceae bacterium]|jgi:GT2 family glycosyltransferase
MRTPLVSFVISTRDRRDVLLSTLGHVYACGLAADAFDVHVVDNASSDGTAAAVREHFPDVQLIASPRNGGSVAKNLALPHALGKFVVFLDDDSYSEPGAIARMIRHFESDPTLGAATFTVTLPNGTRECSAYPDVFIGCGVGLRRRALRLVGGLPNDFFMQAEEYDLSLRLLDGGWTVRRFDDLHVSHLKTPRARLPNRTIRLDVRNNLFLVLRRFPRRQVWPYLFDWTRRYSWIAAEQGATGPFLQGLIEGLLRSMVRPKRAAVSEQAFEHFAKLHETAARLGPVLQRHGARRVLLIDAGKNLYAYWLACRELGVEVVAVADDKLGRPGRRYRGVRVMRDDDARRLPHDLAIVANLSPEHATRRLAEWTLKHDRPVVDLFAETAEAAARAA